MKIINSPSDIENFINKPLTPSEWYHVTQEKINNFANATSDHQWIHVDEERAKKEMPEGKTIAHGYFMVSLLPTLTAQNAQINNTSRTLNYGSDKLRFIGPVPVGSAVHCRSRVTGVTATPKGTKLSMEQHIHVVGQDERPVLVYEMIIIYM